MLCHSRVVIYSTVQQELCKRNSSETKTFASATHSKASSWIGVKSAESSDEQSHGAVAFILWKHGS
jgi:CDGSH-type Zn-finger protein